jgi:hypothetical protein
VGPSVLSSLGLVRLCIRVSSSGVAMSYPICDYACFVRPSHALALGMYGFRARARGAALMWAEFH